MTDLHPIPETDGIATVTPAMAKSWLDNRNLERNRAYSKAIEAKWAAQMRAGLWKTTHQGIAFDWDGFLLDGQHRLGAIVKVNKPVVLDVRVNCDPETFDVLDVGHKRAANQLIQHTHARIITPAARFVGVIDGLIRTGDTRGGVYSVGASTAEILQVVEAWPELGTFAASAVHCRNKGQVLAAPHLAVLAQAARTQYTDRIPTWLDGLAYGENLSGNDSRLHLRNRMAAERRALMTQQHMAYALVVKAWNAYATETPMGVLRLRGDEGMPQVIQ